MALSGILVRNNSTISEVSVCCVGKKHPNSALDVTLADLKGKDAESEEAKEHANSSSLALYG